MSTFSRSLFVLSTIVTLLAGPVGARAIEPTPSPGPVSATEDTSGDRLTAPKPPEFSAELLSCLKTKLGDTAVADLQAGTRVATDAEQAAGDPCFDQFGPKVDPANAQKAGNLKFAPATESCLKEKLGANFRDQMAGVTSRSAGSALQAKVKSCFGAGVIGGVGAPGQLPDGVKSCVVGAVGQAAADALFKGGTPPDPTSDAFKKIESAKCFQQKGFGPPPGHDRPNMSDEAKGCVEKIMGHTFEDTRTEPTDAQKQQIGKDCFGGQGGPGGRGSAPQMPKEVQSCLSDAFGGSLEDLKKGPEFMTDDQRGKADSCFKKNNFNPGGDHGGPGGPNGGPPPNLSADTQKCIEGVLGGSMQSKQPNDEQRQQIGQKCFGGQGGPGGQPGQLNGGPAGQPKPGANLPPDQQACVQKIMGGSTTPPTDAQRQQIQQTCLGGGPGGPNGQPGGDSDNHGGPPPNTQQNRPQQFQPPQNDNGANRPPNAQPPTGGQTGQTPPPQQQPGSESRSNQGGQQPPFNDGGANRPLGGGSGQH